MAFDPFIYTKHKRRSVERPGRDPSSKGRAPWLEVPFRSGWTRVRAGRAGGASVAEPVRTGWSFSSRRKAPASRRTPRATVGGPGSGRRRRRALFRVSEEKAVEEGVGRLEGPGGSSLGAPIVLGENEGRRRPPRPPARPPPRSRRAPAGRQGGRVTGLPPSFAHPPNEESERAPKALRTGRTRCTGGPWLSKAEKG